MLWDFAGNQAAPNSDDEESPSGERTRRRSISGLVRPSVAPFEAIAIAYAAGGTVRAEHSAAGGEVRQDEQQV